MIFKRIGLGSACVIEMEKKADERGFFCRAWCKKEFEAQGLNTDMVQANIAYSRSKGTLRGLHYQVPPREEAKLIRCIRGSIYDVMLDLRRGSETRGKWFGMKLTSEDHKMIYIPQGFAHGYLTLQDDTEVMYQVSEYFSPGFEKGIRFDDPAFSITWPDEIRVISGKDRGWADFTAETAQNDFLGAVQ